MRRFSTRRSTSRSNGPIRYGRPSVINLTSAIIQTVAGLIVVSFFVYNIIISGKTYHHVDLEMTTNMLSLLIGGPLFCSGLFSLLLYKHSGGSSSTTDLDIGRIRHTVETQGRDYANQHSVKKDTTGN